MKSFQNKWFFVRNVLANCFSYISERDVTISSFSFYGRLPDYLVDEFNSLFLALLKEMGILGECQILSFFVSGVNKVNEETG